MPASDELDVFCIIIRPPSAPHHLCMPFLVPSHSIFIDGEVLESMVAFVRALRVCVRLLKKCSSCSGSTGTKKKQCYFGSVDPRLTDGS